MSFAYFSIFPDHFQEMHAYFVYGLMLLSISPASKPKRGQRDIVYGVSVKALRHVHCMPGVQTGGCLVLNQGQALALIF